MKWKKLFKFSQVLIEKKKKFTVCKSNSRREHQNVLPEVEDRIPVTQDMIEYKKCNCLPLGGMHH